MNRFYWSIGIGLAACAALALGGLPDVVKAIIALPGAAALLLALREVSKPQESSQPHPDGPSGDDAFILNATSYMAQRAFDKHVEFCEAYLAKVNESLLLFFELGPGEKVLRRVSELYQIRRQFALWETAEVALFLSRFEAALRQVGEESYHPRHFPAAGADRTELVTKFCGTFGQMIPLENLPAAATPDAAIIRILSALQEHLGIAQLTTLRQHYLAQALRRVQ